MMLILFTVFANVVFVYSFLFFLRNHYIRVHVSHRLYIRFLGSVHFASIYFLIVMGNLFIGAYSTEGLRI